MALALAKIKKFSAYFNGTLKKCAVFYFNLVFHNLNLIEILILIKILLKLLK